MLAASAGWADEVGHIDCAKHPENTQVQAKAAKTEEVVTSLACGERFTILASGYFFTRIQTQDGKIGYVYTNLVTRDEPGTPVRQASAARPKPAARVQATSFLGAAPPESKPATPRKPEPALPQAAPVQASAPTPNGPAPSTKSALPAAPEPVAVQPAPVQTPASNVPAPSATAAQSKPAEATKPEPAPVRPTPAAPAPAANVPAPSATAAESKPAEPTAPEPAPVQPAPAPTPAATTSAPAPSAAAAEPERSPAAQPEPQPTPVQPAAEAVRAPVAARPVMQPRPRFSREPMAEFFGGYAFMRLSGSGYGSNINGALGSFGWNVKPWLQIIADTSYSTTTISGTKTVLYGNHYGPRIFYRPRNGRGATPFGEFLFGGTRVDTTVSGSKTSVNGFSMKAGGGLDWKISSHVTIRLFNFDYYRTSFLTGSENNYWVSTGLVLRLLGGGAQ